MQSLQPPKSNSLHKNMTHSIWISKIGPSIICTAHCTCQPPVSLTSIRRDLLLSAIVRLLLPARDSGTVFLSMSSLPRHSHFVRN